MRKFESRFLGVDQGSVVLFSDFEDDGEMWTGTGPRTVRRAVAFAQTFRAIPAVMVGMSMWDLDRQTNPRADISAGKITVTGFEIVFRTWADTRVARIRADWTAIGEIPNDDDWEVY
ncbi:MAG: H-type lectin domain-containing protein [Paracoccaceae bacterium]